MELEWNSKHEMAVTLMLSLPHQPYESSLLEEKQWMVLAKEIRPILASTQQLKCQNWDSAKKVQMTPLAPESHEW